MKHQLTSSKFPKSAQFLNRLRFLKIRSTGGGGLPLGHRDHQPEPGADEGEVKESIDVNSQQPVIV